MMVYRLLNMAQERWRRLKHAKLIPLVRAGVAFKDGINSGLKVDSSSGLDLDTLRWGSVTRAACRASFAGCLLVFPLLRLLLRRSGAGSLPHIGTEKAVRLLSVPARRCGHSR